MRTSRVRIPKAWLKQVDGSFIPNLVGYLPKTHCKIHC